MKDTLSITLLALVVLVPVSGIADEERPPESGPGDLAENTQNVDTLLADSKYAQRWQLLQPPVTAAIGENGPTSMSDIRFQDASAMARVTRMRKLSLLTLARTDQARLFLGVNEKGVLGVHFSAIALQGNDDYMELARMPYLNSTKVDASEDEVN